MTTNATQAARPPDAAADSPPRALLSDATYCGEAHGVYDGGPGDTAVTAYRSLARALGDDR